MRSPLIKTSFSMTFSGAFIYLFVDAFVCQSKYCFCHEVFLYSFIRCFSLKYTGSLSISFSEITDAFLLLHSGQVGSPKYTDNIFNRIRVTTIIIIQIIFISSSCLFCLCRHMSDNIFVLPNDYKLYIFT